ncbi:hypothetical protein U14_00215 [Candidatus Moduliflexus flocculans]|uniref:Uncharacterized protein n=1 Tax=Candidatus Moduliflexus flocculans TaxID=1499966 RepID=A0A0S6VVF7_9BACT|nr:hypothetical protein U14_00215 [Candidatus Moduliflexus flocculans]
MQKKRQQSGTVKEREVALDNAILSSQQDFSFVLGGPLYQFFRRTGLVDDDLMLLSRRMIILSLFCWLPLLVLSMLDGQIWGGNVTVPFLGDVEVHTKFLLTLPLLIAAELIVHQRMRHLVKQFLDRQLIPEHAFGQFETAIKSALRMRNSVFAEVLLIVFVYIVGILIVWQHYTSLAAATWYATPSDRGLKLSLAGTWYGYVSLPIFQFLLLRWYYRLFIWARFLWQVSRIKLNLNPLHPDQLGGLGFVAGAAHAFALLAAAHGAMLMGFIANRIFYLGASLPQFNAEFILLIAFLAIIVFGPLLVFTLQLADIKRKGKREYDTLAQDYVREFEAKWLRGKAPEGETLLGSGDIQSLADLGNSLQVMRNMRIIPVTKESIMNLTIATFAPITPLVLTMMPLEELLKKLFGILF